MEIGNINIGIRKMLSKCINYGDIVNGKDEDCDNFKTIELYNYLKDNNLFDYAAGILFITSYFVSNLVCKDFPDDDAEKEKLEILKSFNSLEEFKLILDEDYFAELCADVSYFNSLDLFSKKQVIMYSLEDKAFLKQIFPCYILDILYYLNPVDSKELLDRYHENYDYSKSKNIALEDTICQGVDDLIELEYQDFDSYKYVILDMIEIYYKYNIYLISNNTKVDEFSELIIEMIESNLNELIKSTINNAVVLEPIVRSYLEYNILSIDEKDKIEDFYKVNSNKVRLAKVLKKSNDLKNKK